MRKAIRASALILLLACSAQAGDMPNDVIQPPPPPPASPVVTDGEIPNMSASLIEAALALFSVVLP